MGLLADDFIEAAALAPPGERFNGFRHVAHLIQRSHRFVISREARDAVGGLLTSKPSSLLSALTYARLPFPTTWLEWDPPPGGRLAAGQYQAKRVGALLRAQDKRVVRMFTCWRHVDPPPVDFAVPPRYRSFVELVNKIGVSALEAGWDFGSVDGQPELNVDPTTTRGWFRMRMATDNPDTLSRLRDDEHNSIKHVLKDPTELEALMKVERCAAFRIHREVFGEETIIAAKQSGVGVGPIIADLEDEMGPIIGLLILMNAKNCVDIERVSPPPKLNKARVKRAKQPLVDYSTVHIKLGQGDQRYASSAGVSQEEVRRHIVRGHFKLRKHGVFWWRPHLRGSESEGVIVRQGYEVD